MAWQIELSGTAERELNKLDPPQYKRIVQFLRDRLGRAENPRSLGAALHGSSLGEFWRYRVGAFRLICRIEDARLLILVLHIGHRREVYR